MNRESCKTTEAKRQAFLLVLCRGECFSPTALFWKVSGILVHVMVTKTIMICCLSMHRVWEWRDWVQFHSWIVLAYYSQFTCISKSSRILEQISPTALLCYWKICYIHLLTVVCMHDTFCCVNSTMSIKWQHLSVNILI